MARISKKPAGRVTGLTAPERQKDGLVLKSTWKVPAAVTKNSARDRFTGLRIQWVYDMSNGAPSFVATIGTGSTERTTNLASFSTNSGGRTRSFSRNSLFPRTNVRLRRVTFRVQGYNAKGEGPWVSMTRALGKPQKPEVGKWEQDHDTGHLTVKVTAWDDGGGHSERYDTRWQLQVYDSRTQEWATTEGTFTGTEHTIEHDVATRQQLAYGEHVLVRARAMSRGLAGMSDGLALGSDSEEKAWTAWSTYVVAYPALPTLGEPLAPDRTATGKVTVPVSANSTTEHPVSGMRLQRLVSVDCDSAERATAMQGWEDTDSVDDAGCTALAAPVAELLPDPGKTSWVRVRAWNDWDGMFVRYSEPVRVAALERTVAEAVSGLTLASVEPGADGGTLVARLGWTDGTTPDTGTELSWSTDPDAWTSNRGPETWEFEWEDAAPFDAAYDGTATCHIRGLDEGVPYHVRARRYLEGDARVWGAYAGPLVATPVSSPGSVALSAPAVLPAGSDLALSWTYDTEATQTAWRVLCGRVVVAEGTDAGGSCTIPAERVASMAEGGSLSVSVEVSTGSAFAASEERVVAVADRPMLSLAAPDVTTQPMGLVAACSAPCSLAVAVSAQGCAGDWRGGDQLPGDGVWSDVLTPAWSRDASTGLYTATVTTPAGLDLRDGARYDATATATDPSTGLASDAASCVVAVAWARQAPEPPESIAVTPADEVDEDGNRTRACTIALAPPVGADDGDLCDVWRMTPDGAELVAEGVATDAIVHDPWAPYGGEGLAYRVVLRTPDGDCEWADYGYELAGDVLRVDFGGSYVELPYNLSLSDSWEKDFEARRKLDGSVDGYWGAGALRKSGLRTDLIRVEDAGQARLVRELARWDGPCYVRTPDGCAYAADVEVTDLSQSCDDAAMAVALDCTAVGLPPEYMAEVEGEGE